MQPKGRFTYGMQLIPQDGTFRPKVLGVQDPAGDGVGGARVFVYGNANGTPIDDYAFDTGDGIQFDAALATIGFQYGMSSDGSFDAVRVLEFGEDIGDVGLDTGIVATAAQLYLGNGAGSLAVAMISANATVDNTSASDSNWLRTFGGLFLFDGSAYDRARGASAGNISASTQVGVQLVTPPGNWSVTHTPAANTQATITRAAGAAGVRHVVTSISARLIADAGSVSGTVQVNLRDGATGAGTILWSETLKVGGAGSLTAENAEIKLSGLSIFGTAATALTLEFSAAGGANTVESVAMTGYDVGA